MSGVGPCVGMPKPRHRRQVGLDEADATDLADTEGAADIRVAKVDIVEGAVGAFGQIHDVAVGAIDRSIGGLEVEDAVDIAVGVERQTLDPVLRVVGEEVASLVAARELACRDRRTRR